MIIASSVLGILNIFNVLSIVRHIWNIIFGTLMVFLQLNWKQMITRNFGFLNHWFLRGCFYIFVGTNSMTWNSGTDGKICGTAGRALQRTASASRVWARCRESAHA
jgi:hypothetical protein